MTDTLSLMAADLDEMKTDLDTVQTYIGTIDASLVSLVAEATNIVALRNDGTLGEGVFGKTASQVSDTTPVEVLAAPGAGFKYRLRRILFHNSTSAEYPDIVIEDDVPTVLFIAAPGSQADAQPNFDTGWMVIPIDTAENVAINARATGGSGDTDVMIWAEKVAV